MEQTQNANKDIDVNNNSNQNLEVRKIRNDVPYKRERVVRVIVQMRNGTTSAGTGFFISPDGEILTCAHVISGTELRNLKAIDFKVNNSIPNYEVNDDKQSQHTKFQNYLTQSIISLQVELANGERVMAEIKKIDEDLDVALLKIAKNDLEKLEKNEGTKNGVAKNGTPFFLLNDTYTPEYDESTFFCGFQMTGGYDNPTQYPFSINRAVVSAVPDVVVAGDRHEHIQLNSINLGGKSGAPLFIEGSNTVIGIINGNMNWSGGIPLCIAYATSLQLIKDRTDIL
jgi:V8-like Glu-specific endopeptidase